MRQDNERAGHRHARLQEILLEEIRAWLRDEVTDPSLEGVRIASVSLSADYRHVRIHFTVLGQPSEPRARRAEVEQALLRAGAWLRAELAGNLDLKRTPELRFLFDGFVTEEPSL